jgi:lipopolysaccharide transport system permease protein
MTPVEHLRAAIPIALFRHRPLLLQLIRREIESRYRGSMLGVLWSFVTPVLMLAVFTFVFSTVFQAKWGNDVGDRAHFALMLFPGMVLYAFFSEIITRAPGLIVANPNYVKKIVFPLELLSAIAVGSALFQACMGLLVVAAFAVALNGSLPGTAWSLPLVLAPFVIMLVGLGWLLSSLGVYLRDLGQLTGVLATGLMFLSPVFYPLEALPPAWRSWAHLNPLTLILEQTRAVLLLGQRPDVAALAVYAVGATTFAAAALYWFQRSRKGFADVL